jgi:hypothetical protein
MVRQLERRISRLESSRKVSPASGLPMLIICEPGESEESAIMRVCGPQGLPERAPEDGPHLIIVPVSSRSRDKDGVAAGNDILQPT